MMTKKYLKYVQSNKSTGRWKLNPHSDVIQPTRRTENKPSVHLKYWQICGATESLWTLVGVSNDAITLGICHDPESPLIGIY